VFEDGYRVEGERGLDAVKLVGRQCSVPSELCLELGRYRGQAPWRQWRAKLGCERSHEVIVHG
jgi:hypothetical protein